MSGDIPRYPAQDGPARDDDGDRPPIAWRTYLLIGAGVALVLLFVVLHLSGVLGPGEH